MEILTQINNCVENVYNVIITCFTQNNFCQLNGENYFDEDGILDELIENERRGRRRRFQNHDANSNSEKIRNTIKMYIDKKLVYAKHKFTRNSTFLSQCI